MAGPHLLSRLPLLVGDLLAGASIAICATEVMESLAPTSKGVVWRSDGILRKVIEYLGWSGQLQDTEVTIVFSLLLVVLLLVIFLNARIAFNRNSSEHARLAQALTPTPLPTRVPQEPDHSDSKFVAGVNLIGIGALLVFAVPFAPILAAVSALAAAGVAAEAAKKEFDYRQEVAMVHGQKRGEDQTRAQLATNLILENQRSRAQLRVHLAVKFTAMFIFLSANYLVPWIV